MAEVYTDGEVVVTTVTGEEFVQSFERAGQEVTIDVPDGTLVDNITVRQTQAYIEQ